MPTIGEAIERKAQQHIELYERFLNDAAFQSKASTLAKHDLVMAIYINEQALEELEAYIEKRESD